MTETPPGRSPCANTKPEPAWRWLVFGLVSAPAIAGYLGVLLYAVTLVAALEMASIVQPADLGPDREPDGAIIAVGLMGFIFGLVFGVPAFYLTLAPVFLISWAVWHAFSPRHRWHYAGFTALVGGYYGYTLATDFAYPVIPETQFTAAAMTIGGALIGGLAGGAVTASYKPRTA